jgi:hypothetical protein
MRAHPTSRQWFIGLTVGGGMLLFFGLGGSSSVSGLRANGVVTDAVVTDVTHFKGSSTYFLRYRVSGSRVAFCCSAQPRDTSWCADGRGRSPSRSHPPS